MLVMHTGRPGAGKSYNAVAAEVVPALKAGRLVVTNMPLNVEALEADIPGASDLVAQVERAAGQPVPFSVLEHYTAYERWRHPEDTGMGPLYVIDEASQALPGTGRGTVPEEIKHWFEEHRHVGARVVLITQQRDYVTKSIRGLAEYIYDFKNLGLLGVRAAYIKRTYDGTGTKPLKVQWPLWYRRKVYGYYNSYTKGGGPVKERGGALWKQWRVIAPVVIIGWWLVGQLFGGEDPPKPAEPATSVAAPAATQTAAEDPTPRPSIDLSEDAKAALQRLEEARRLLDAERAVRLAQLELDLVQRSVCDHVDRSAPARRAGGGGGMFGGGDAEAMTADSVCRLVAAPPAPPAHLLAGAAVRIGASVSVGGDDKGTVWLAIRRHGQTQQVRADSLRAMGWRFTLRKPCELAVHGPWEGLLSCDWLEIPAA